MTPTGYPHIERAENGTLYVAGTRLKVRLLIETHLAWKYQAEQLEAGYPDLTLAAAHSILAYFYDNEAAVRAEIDAAQRWIEEDRRKALERPEYQEKIAKLGAAAAAEQSSAGGAWNDDELDTAVSNSDFATLKLPRDLIGSVLSAIATTDGRLHALLERNADGHLAPNELAELKSLAGIAHIGQMILAASGALPS